METVLTLFHAQAASGIFHVCCGEQSLHVCLFLSFADNKTVLKVTLEQHIRSLANAH